MMNKIFKWIKKFNFGYFHEKIVFISFLFLLIVLSSDIFFQNLLISGYALVLLTLTLIACTTCATCRKIKWALNSKEPINFLTKKDNTKYVVVKYLTEHDDEIFILLFNKLSFESFKYPTSLNEQVRLLLKDIEKDFVKTWYSEISQNPSFLFDSHLILEEIFFKIIRKLKTINCKNLILSVLILYLNHLQEYKKSLKKLVRLNNEDETKPKIELEDTWRYMHPGSQSDQILNYYINKVTKTVLKEFSPHEFANSLQCKILSGIIGRKVFRRLLMTVEDSNWINLKLIYLLHPKKHKELLKNRVYVVKEKPVVAEEEEFLFKKPVLLSKRYLAPNIFDSSRNLFERNEIQTDNCSQEPQNVESQSKPVEKQTLTLPLYQNGEGSKGNISTVLSGLISSTAGPLLPDNISVRYQALNKMWQSPVADVKKDISESITNSFKKVFFDVPKDKKLLTRSKSTESFAEGGLRNKDVSFGEELSENIRFAPAEGSDTHSPPPSRPLKKLTKTRSFDNDSLLLEDVPGREAEEPGRKSSSPEHQRDVSPVYEEPEDFATTIAKLRSLLQQRESNSTMSDKSNQSIDSQSIGFSMDKSDSSNKSQSLEGDPFDSQLSSDIPTDGRLFVNLSIPKGELVTDSSGSSYVLYTILYDGIYVLKDGRNPEAEPELVLQTTEVKRRFQEFLHLQTKLEENSNYKSIMKNIKGPSKWVNLPSGPKADEGSTSSRRLMLEAFLRQLCSRPDVSASPELHEFLGYGQTGSCAFVKKDADSSGQRIDKLLANKVTGVFNSIKTVLPSFDFDSTALIATNDTVKSFHEQKLLQGFLNFGNKPEFFELNLNFSVKEPTGDSLTDAIRQYLSEKSDCIEDAVDVLDSSDWLSEQRECRFISAEEKCVWQGYKDVALVDELDCLDSWLPVGSVFCDILCELFQNSDSWIIREPVVRLAKFFFGHLEVKAQEKLVQVDWDRIFANAVRLLRIAVFQSEAKDNLELDQEYTKKVLKDIIVELMPDWMKYFFKPDDFSSAVSLFVDSFQNFRGNRDFLLRLMDILLVHLLSCHHLSADST